MKKLFFVILVFVALALLIVATVRPSRHEAVFYPMGGIPFRVIAYDRSDKLFGEDVKSAQETVERLEKIFSAHRDSSELTRINTMAHGKAIEVSPDIGRVILSAKDWSSKTDGAFDMTVAPLIRLWKNGAEKQTVPAESAIKKTLESVGSDKIGIEDQNGKIAIKMRTEGLELDLGGIAKGDIVDQVAAELQTRGVKRGVVQASGDTKAFGPGKFRIGIQDPTAKAGAKLMGEIEMPAGAVVTSGNYERFVKIGGKKYSHIIDPRSGLPVNSGLVAVTVMAPDCISADAVATALMVMGREKAISFLRKNSSFRAILIEAEGSGHTVWVQSEFAADVRIEKPWSERVGIF